MGALHLRHPSMDDLIMKRALFFCFLMILSMLIMVIFMQTPYDNHILSITFILPGEFAPYYSWLLSFPGWINPQPMPDSQITPTLKPYYSLIPSFDSEMI
jgi:hypothetical protein